MPKNILIFSDGTGQAGGLRPDQRLSNIYKLYRATRIGPDSAIDPAKQIVQGFVLGLVFVFLTCLKLGSRRPHGEADRRAPTRFNRVA